MFLKKYTNKSQFFYNFTVCMLILGKKLIHLLSVRIDHMFGCVSFNGWFHDLFY